MITSCITCKRPMSFVGEYLITCTNPICKNFEIEHDAAYFEEDMDRQHLAQEELERIYRKAA